jgi:hypothetical protein
MHPQIIRDQPGECPICHMTLERVELDPAGAHAGHLDQAQAPAQAAFNLPEARQQLIGVKIGRAQARPLVKRLRLAGRATGSGALAQLLEVDAGLVRAGQKAELIGSGGQRVDAQVGGVDGGLDPYTRSFGVLIDAAGRPAWLRTGVYVEVRVEVDLGKKLAVPEEAVIDTGERHIAFVRKENTRFEPRSLSLGAAGEGWVQVLSGLTEGEEVVVSANFLIDSEARFKAALEQYQ